MKPLKRALSLLMALLLVLTVLPWDALSRAEAVGAPAEPVQTEQAQAEPPSAPAEEPQQDRDATHYFAVQPQGGSIAPDGYHKFTWKTSFTPEKLEVRVLTANGQNRLYKTLENTAKSYTLNYETVADYGPDAKFFVRAYFSNGSATLDYVNSNFLIFQLTERAFTQQPQNGNIVLGGVGILQWKTNFTPEWIEIHVLTDNSYNHTVATLSGTATMHLVLYSEADYDCDARFYVRACWRNSVTDYIESVSSDFVTFTLQEREFTAQPTGGNIPIGGTKRLTWDTNFYPDKYEVHIVTNGGRNHTIATLPGDTKYYDLQYDAVAYEGGFKAYVEADFTRRNCMNVSLDKSISSNNATITLGQHYFTAQPSGGSIAMDGSANLTWNTNFTPTKVCVYVQTDGSHNHKIATLDGSARSYEVTYAKADYSVPAKFYVKAYYNYKNEMGYIDEKSISSDMVTFDLEQRAITAQPGPGGNLAPGDTAMISWNSNFTPDKIKIRAVTTGGQNFVVETLAGDMKFYMLTYDKAAKYGDGAKYYAVLYYTQKNAMTYSIEDSMETDYAIYTLTPRAVTKQPVGGSVSPGQTHTFTWNTNFTPRRYELRVRTYAGQTKTVATLEGTQKSYPLSYDQAVEYGTKAKYFVRAYYGDGYEDYVETNWVELLVDTNMFSTQPAASITVAEPGSKTISWNTYLATEEAAVVGIPSTGTAYETLLQTLAPDAKSCTITFAELEALGTDTGKLYVKAKYGGRWYYSRAIAYSLSYLTSGQIEGTDLSWDFSKSTGKLTVSGTGAIPNCYDTPLPWRHWVSKVTEIEIGSGITEIGEYSLHDCKARILRLPASVTSVKSMAFWGCSVLTDVYYAGTQYQRESALVIEDPEFTNSKLVEANWHYMSLAGGTCGTNLVWTLSENYVLTISGAGAMTDWDSASGQPWKNWRSQIRQVIIQNGAASVGSNAFCGCTALTAVDASAAPALTSVGEAAFQGCTNLTAMSLPAGLTEIKDFAFQGCASLTAAALPAALTRIGEQAFDGCAGLRTLVFNQSLQEIGAAAFRNTALGGTLTIPASVTVIGDGAFSYCASISGLSLPAGLTSLGRDAFRGCAALAGEVTIPGGVGTVPSGLFKGCSALTDVAFSAGITAVGDEAFSGCGALRGILRIPEGVTEIGYEALYGCWNVSCVHLPGSLDTVGVRAFSGCNKLTTVYYSGLQTQWNAIDIKTGNEKLLNANIVFSGMSGTVNELHWSVDGNGELTLYTSGSSAMPAIPSPAPWVSAADAITVIRVRNMLSSVSPNAFRGLTAVREVYFDNTVTSIGANAFADCTSITDFWYDDLELAWNQLVSGGAVASGNAPILNANKHFLTEMEGEFSTGLGWKIDSDGVLSFYNLHFGSGDDLNIPDFSQGGAPWYQYKDLITSVVMEEDTVTGIGAYAFYGLENLETVRISSTVTQLGIGEHAFDGCTSLHDVYYDSISADWDEISIWYEGNDKLFSASMHFGKARGEIDGTVLCWELDDDGLLFIYNYTGYYGNDPSLYTIPDYPGQDEPSWSCYSVYIQSIALEDGILGFGEEAFSELNNAETIQIPDSVTSIGDLAFASSGFVEVTIPDSVTQLGTGVFWCCDDLLRVNLSGSLTEIPNSSFFGCSLEGAVRIPEGVTSIGEDAFRNCGQLEYLYFPSTLTTIAKGAFLNCDNLGEIYVNKYWFESGSITIGENNPRLLDQAEWFYKCPGGTLDTGLTWTLWENGCLEITGSGPMPELASYSAQPWAAFRSRVLYISVGDGVTSVGKYAFRGLINARSVSLPGSVTKLGEQAFYDCDGLTSVTVPEGVTYIAGNCFSSCGALQTVSLPTTLTLLDGASFASCGALTEINLPEGLTRIGTNTFRDCRSLPRIDIPYNVTTVWEYAFFGCTSLEQVRFEENVTTIRPAAFGNCPNLSTVVYGGLEEWWDADVNIINYDYEVGGETYNNSDLLTAAVTFLGVPLRERRFPDPAFRAALAGGNRDGAPDADGNGYISQHERELVGSLNVSEMGLSSVKGVEWFPALYKLDCSGNLLTEIDVSSNPDLLYLYCEYNLITRLDLSGLEQIEIVSCGNNRIEELLWDDDACASISELYCSGNALSELDLDHSFDWLYYLDCSDNELEELTPDPNDFPDLEVLKCAGNRIAELDVDGLGLWYLDCSDNGMTELDVNPALEDLFCAGNGLTELDLSDVLYLVKSYKEGSFEDLGGGRERYSRNGDWVLEIDSGLHLIGADDTMIEVYFVFKQNDLNDGEEDCPIYVYAFGSNNVQNAAFPGAEPESFDVVCDAETDNPTWCRAYRFDADTYYYHHVIFSDGGSRQTGDLAFITDAGGKDYVIYYADDFGTVGTGEDLWPADDCVHVDPACETPGSNTWFGLKTAAGRTQVLDALGHVFTAGTVHAPTCTGQGWTDYECSRCHSVEQRAFTEPAGHSWGDWEVSESPSCDGEGTRIRECAACHETEEAAVEPLGHSWSEPEYSFSGITEPGQAMTCTAATACTECGRQLTETVAGEYAVVIAPTTAQTGLGAYSFHFEELRFADQVWNVELEALGAETLTVYVLDRSDALELSAVAHGSGGETGGSACTPLGVDKDGCFYYQIQVNITDYGQGLYLTDTAGARCPASDTEFLHPETDAAGRDWVIYILDADYTATVGEEIWIGPETVVAAPTCVETGSSRYTGLLSGEGRTFPVPALGHEFAEGVCIRCGAIDPNYTGLPVFTDVPENAWYHDAVYWSLGREITNGTSDTTFSPNRNCTRAQIVTFLWRAKGSPEPASAENPFTDVPEDSYYRKAVLWAVEQGITNGTSATTFMPNGACSRAQAVTFLWRAEGSPAAQAANPFTDVRETAWYRDAVLWAVENRITNGVSADAFAPGMICTRAQVVTFLYRAYKEP